MLTIHKKAIAVKTPFFVQKVRLRLPEYLNVLCAKAQGDSVAIWYETDTNCDKTIEVDVALAMTGQDLSALGLHIGSWLYLGTVMFGENGNFVLHVYVSPNGAHLRMEKMINEEK